MCKCVYCQKDIPDGAEWCGACQNYQADKLKHCHQCRRPIPDSSKWCFRCEAYQQSETSARCRRCKRVIPGDVEVCVYCKQSQNPWAVFSRSSTTVLSLLVALIAVISAAVQTRQSYVSWRNEQAPASIRASFLKVLSFSGDEAGGIRFKVLFRNAGGQGAYVKGPVLRSSQGQFDGVFDGEEDKWISVGPGEIKEQIVEFDLTKSPTKDGYGNLEVTFPVLSTKGGSMGDSQLSLDGLKQPDLDFIKKNLPAKE